MLETRNNLFRLPTKMFVTNSVLFFTGLFLAANDWKKALLIQSISSLSEITSLFVSGDVHVIVYSQIQRLPSPQSESSWFILVRSNLGHWTSYVVTSHLS